MTMGCGVAEATGLGLVCFVVINLCMLSVNRVDLGFFFCFINFVILLPPPPGHGTEPTSPVTTSLAMVQPWCWPPSGWTNPMGVTLPPRWPLIVDPEDQSRSWLKDTFPNAEWVKVGLPYMEGEVGLPYVEVVK